MVKKALTEAQAMDKSIVVVSKLVCYGAKALRFGKNLYVL
jgi:hypothetical protein